MKKRILIISLSLAVIINMVLLIPGFSLSASAETINIKIANYFPPPAKQSKICEQFAKDLEERSKGRIKTRYFPGRSLLKAPAMYKGVEAGIADIGYAHVYYTPGRMPVSEAGGLPLGYPSAWVASHVVNDFYRAYSPKEWNKVKVLSIHGAAPSLIISKKPVRTLADLKGLTIRAPGVPGTIIKALGGTPAPTPMMEVYDALAKGVNDGVYTPFETLKAFRFAEVVDYTTTSWQIGNTYVFYLIMNKNKYNSLPPDLQKVVDQLAGEYQERFALVWNEVELAGKAFGAKKGVEYIELSDAEAAKWKKAAEKVFEGYTKTMVGKGFSETEVNGWIAFMRERIDYWTKKQMEYKIPSPTGPAGMRPAAYVLK